MKAKPITHNGINFSSKLEGRWYNFFTEECKFEVEYEPDVEGVRGYIPDFKIKGRLYVFFIVSYDCLCRLLLFTQILSTRHY